MAILDHEDGTRTCTNCGTRLPINQYDIDKKARTGRRGECKSCRSQKMKAWYAANQERQMLRARERFAKNIDQIRIQDMQRYERHREKRIKLATNSYHRRRAKLHTTTTTKVISDTALRKYLGDECCYCGITMDFKRIPGTQYNPNRATIEHITPMAKGGAHDWSNVALCCRQCNIRKQTLDVEEFVSRLGLAARGALAQEVIRRASHHRELS